MPDKQDKPTVSFPLAAHDAAGNVVYRNVHVVVVKHVDKHKKETPVMTAVVLPLLAALTAAGLLVWLALRVRPGKKIDQILNRFEKLGNFLEPKDDSR